ncbi:VIR protein [Plasmodium vivax]|uniref:VIR protein n=1 Tax=Plasmodium vivax TaxID=5855 RepID=A0A1G4E805_PLAVI|nr:VIR protein [Plasmodium vivax]
MAEDYTFFKDCYYFINDEKNALTIRLFNYYAQNCNKMHDWEQDYTNICIKFKKIINFMNGKLSIANFYLDNSYKTYMNFWLNYQLGHLNNSKFTAESFYKIIEEYDPEFFKHNFKITAHNISKNELEDMESLYKLYKVYYDIKTMNPVITDVCNTKENECFSLYTNLIRTCTPGVENNFCKALLHFKDVYNKLKSEQICLSKELPGLSQSQELQQLAQELPGLPQPQDSPGLPSQDQEKIPSERLDTDSQQTQDQVQSEGSEPISSVPTELPPEKNKMIGFAGSILGSSTVLFSIYLFTPLGSWFRRKFQRKKANVGYIKEGSHKLFDISERQYKNYNKMKYGISYESFADS